ncbi:hypothetical protein SAMN05660835_01519 [Desulfurella multipotens]|uniref:Uncharacterized protein n=1 Tax=Desulfurella multipotens TaxID=79269 RepID=A0A1G6Q860_9BACT|nr:hypothetical protein [Desulfurella multipotens]SDC88411.1 hypothetical protein SAMN05660835_01519 [Desulfurella multipotens]
MIYTVNPKKIMEVADKIIANNPDLYFSIAVSCEPTSVLPPNETFATMKVNNMLSEWRNLYEYFASRNNFLGITIQSLEDFWI